MSLRIEYRNDDFEVVATMPIVNATPDEACVIAQKYMSQFSNIRTAHVFHPNTETVISKTTAWQKNNG